MDTLTHATEQPQKSSRAAKRRRRIERTRAELVRLFPDCFVAIRKPSARKKPLAVGIKAEIRKRHPELGGFLHISDTLANYTLGPKYQIGFLRETHRVNLDGSPAQPITDEERAHARHILKKYWPAWFARLDDSTKGAQST